MGKIFHERKLVNIEYIENGTKTLELPRNNIYRALTLKLSGTCAKGGTAPSGKKSLTPYRLIKRIEIVANGKDVIKSIPFSILYIQNKYDFGVKPDMTDVTETTNTDSFVATAILPFAFTRSRRPVDGALDARILQTLDLRITWGAVGDLFGTLNNATVSNVKLELKTQEYINVEPNFKAFVNKMSEIQREVLSTTNNLQENMAVERVYRRFFIVTTVADVLSNAVMNNIQLKSGTFVFKDYSASMLRSEMKSMFAVETLEDGVYIVEIISDGMISESLNTGGMQSLEFIFDVTKQSGTNYIYIYPEVVEG